MTEATRPIRAWELWANPILRRYIRARLRLKGFLPAALATLVFTTFFFSLFYVVLSKETLSGRIRDGIKPSIQAQVRTEYPELSNRDLNQLVRQRTRLAAPEPQPEELRRFAARIAIFPLLFIQGFILMFFGTGTVAGCVTQESVEGMIDYQRLTPMSPLAKILGYLFGLPIREYALTLITLPFLAFAISAGEIPLKPLALFYLVFLTSVILYHLTGLVAGTVVKRRWMAGGSARALVILLYVLLPHFSAFGLVIFPYLTVSPAMGEHLSDLIKGTPVEALLIRTQRQNLGPTTVPWFHWQFTPTQFSLIIQVGLCLIFGGMLHRRWRDQHGHLLGKVFAVGTFGGIMLLLLGNLLSVIPQGRVSVLKDSGATHLNTLLVVSLFGLALLCFAVIWIYLITPDRHEAVRGLRRARKLRQRWVPFHADEASSLGAAWIIAAIAACTWCLYARSIFDHTHITPPRLWPLYCSAALMLPLLCFHIALEVWGKRLIMIAALLLWIVPVLASILLIAMRENLARPAFYIAGFSGFAMPFYSVESLIGLPIANVSNPGTRAGQTEAMLVAQSSIRQGFHVALLFYAVLVPFLLDSWRKWRRHLAKEVEPTPMIDAPVAAG